MVCRLALEEVGHVDLVLVVFVVGMGKDIGTLKRLRAVAEDVIDNEDSGGSAGRASGVWRMSTIIGEEKVRAVKHTRFETTDVDKFALLFVAFCDYWGNSAACLI